MLATGETLTRNVQFYFASRKFADENPKVVDAVLAALQDIDQWASQNQDAVALELGTAIHVPQPIIAVALKRLGYGVRPVDGAIIAGQQKIADAFFKLGLLPKPIVVAAAVRRTGS